VSHHVLKWHLRQTAVTAVTKLANSWCTCAPAAAAQHALLGQQHPLAWLCLAQVYGEMHVVTAVQYGTW
jgi:hypothetical protein